MLEDPGWTYWNMLRKRGYALMRVATTPAQDLAEAVRRWWKTKRYRTLKKAFGILRASKEDNQHDEVYKVP